MRSDQPREAQGAQARHGVMTTQLGPGIDFAHRQLAN